MCMIVHSGGERRVEVYIYLTGSDWVNDCPRGERDR